jgi:hypothetical protein
MGPEAVSITSCSSRSNSTGLVVPVSGASGWQDQAAPITSVVLFSMSSVGFGILLPLLLPQQCKPQQYVMQSHSLVHTMFQRHVCARDVDKALVLADKLAASVG